MAKARFVEVASALLETSGLGGFIHMLDDLSSGDSRIDDGSNSHVVTLTRENWVHAAKGGRYERMLTVRSRTYDASDN